MARQVYIKNQNLNDLSNETLDKSWKVLVTIRERYLNFLNDTYQKNGLSLLSLI